MPAICNFELNLFYEHLRKGRLHFYYAKAQAIALRIARTRTSRLKKPERALLR